MFQVIELNSSNTSVIGTDQFKAEIITGSKGPVIVAPWGAYGKYPLVKSFYARAASIDTAYVPVPGVILEVFFESTVPDTAKSIKFNIWQEGALYYKYPWYG